jgi:3'-5' exonuclease
MLARVTRFLVLDLETVPDEELVGAVDGEPTRPYAEQVHRLLAARRAQSGGRSDFLPIPYHRPIAACTLEAGARGGVLAVEDVACWTDLRGDEGEFLAHAWRRLEGRTLVTFHGRGFDLPVLELRSLKLGVPAPAWFSGGRQGEPEDHQDLLDLLSNGGVAPAAPLDLYAKLVGLPGKESVAGKDVAALYARRAIDEITAYCMSDVVQTWLLFLRYQLTAGVLTPEGYARSAACCRDELPGLFARRLGPRPAAFLGDFLGRCAPFFGEAGAGALRQAL